MPQGASGGPASWRKQQRAGRQAAGTSQWKKWVSTLIAVGMIVGLGIALWIIIQTPKTHLGVIVAQGYGEAFPVNPDMKVGIDPINQLLAGGHLKSADRWTDFETSNSESFTRSIQLKVDEWRSRELDPVILYINAHGVLHEGEPYLLYSDANAEAFRSSLEADQDWGERAKAAPLTAVFDQLNSEIQNLKLVILDSGRLGYDPWLGAFSGRYAQEVAATVQDHEDPNLFVILSHSLFESTDGPVEAGSPFWTFVAEGLGGAADLEQAGGNGDHQLKLNELFRYVWNRSIQAYADKEGDFSQTPLLLQGGVGVVDLNPDKNPLEQVVIHRLPRPQAEEEAEAAPEEDSKGDGEPEESQDAAEKTAGPSQLRNTQLTSLNQEEANGGPQGADSTAAEQGVSEQTEDESAGESEEGQSGGSESGESKSSESQPAPPAEADPKKQESPPAEPAAAETSGGASDDTDALIVGSIWELWRSVASLNRDFWGPTDVAPQYARRVEHQLIRAEQDLRAGKISPIILEEVEDDLKALADFLPQLSAGQRPPRQPRFRSKLDEELRAIVDAALKYPDIVKPNQNAAQASVHYLRKITRHYNYCVYQLPALVRWQSLVRVTDFEQVRRLNRDYLKIITEMHDQLFRLADAPLAPGNEKTLSKYVAPDQYEQDGGVHRIWRSIQEEISRQVTAAMSDQGLVGQKHRTRVLKLTLLSPSDRIRVLNSIRMEQAWLEPPAEFVRPATPDFRVSNARYQQHWNRLTGLYELETEVAKFASKAERFPTLALRSNDEDAISARVEDCRLALFRWKRGLPDQLAKAQPTEHRLLLCFADPRARELELDRARAKQSFAVQPRRRQPVLRFVQSERKGIPIVQQQESPFELAFTSQELDVSAAIQFRVTFDADLLSVQYRGQVLTTEIWTNLAPQDVQKSFIPLQVRAKTDSTSVATASCTAELRSGSVRNPCDISFQLPKPNEVDLAVVRRGSSRTQLERDGVVWLENFPNRPTNYDFFLVNRSGKPKTISATLVRIPDGEGRSWAPGKLSPLRWRIAPEIEEALFVAGDVRRGLRRGLENNVVAKATLKLAAEETQGENDQDFFQRLVFKSPEPEKPEGEAAPPPAPAEKKAVDLSYGMACILSDGDETWVKWLPVEVFHPSRYLEPPTFSWSDGKIQIQLVKLADYDGDTTKDQHPWSEESPGEVRWLQKDLTFDTTQDETTLQAPAPGNRTELVYLSVDGYPRAFALRVDCREGRRGNNETELHTASRIQRVTAFYSAINNEPVPPVNQSVLRDGMRVVFNRDGCRRLQVGFEVDVPTNTFNNRSASGVQLIWNDRPVGAPKYADRHNTVELVECKGGLTVLARVSDFVAEVVANPVDAPVPLEVDLPLGMQPNYGDRVAAEVFLDGVEPVIRKKASVNSRSRVAKGETLKMDFQVQDVGGLTKMEYAIDVPGEEPKWQAKALQGAVQDAAVELPTEALEPGKYRLLARAQDQAGLQSNQVGVQFQVLAATAASVAKKGSIRGIVRGYRGAKLSGAWELTVEGPKQFKLLMGDQSDDEKAVFKKDGSFHLQDLPFGDYAVSVYLPAGALTDEQGDRESVTLDSDEEKQVRLEGSVKNASKLK